MWWYHSTKAAKIIWVTLDGAMHGAPISCQNTLLGASISVIFPHTSWVISLFVSNFVAMATGVGRGRIFLASFHSPTPKPPVIHKDLVDISYISRVIADFVLNFVAMATGVGRGRICLAPFNSLTPKTPRYAQRSRGYLLYKPSYGRFC